MLADQAGESTSDSLGIDSCSLLFVAASAGPTAAPASKFRRQRFASLPTPSFGN